MRERGAVGLAVIERREQLRTFLDRAAQDRVDEPGAAGARRLTSSTLSLTAAWSAIASRYSSWYSPIRSAASTAGSSSSSGRRTSCPATWSSVRRRCTVP